MNLSSSFLEKISSLYFVDEINHKISEESIELAREHSFFDNKILNLSDYSSVARALGKQHPTLGITWAMHVQQLAGMSATHKLEHYIQDIISRKSIIASATTESSIGSQFVRSKQNLEIGRDSEYEFERECKIVSYYELADYILATFNVIDGNETNTRLILLEKSELNLVDSNKLEFVGLKSLSNIKCILSGKININTILSRDETKASFSKMIQFGHIGWSSVWLGMIDRLVECTVIKSKKRNTDQDYTLLGQLKEGQIACEAIIQHAISNSGNPIVLNALKSFVSTKLNSMATNICGSYGMDGISESDSKYTIARLCRDAHVSVCMFPNSNLYSLIGKQTRISRG